MRDLQHCAICGRAFEYNETIVASSPDAPGACYCADTKCLETAKAMHRLRTERDAARGEAEARRDYRLRCDPYLELEPFPWEDQDEASSESESEQ